MPLILVFTMVAWDHRYSGLSHYPLGRTNIINKGRALATENLLLPMSISAFAEGPINIIPLLRNASANT